MSNNINIVNQESNPLYYKDDIVIFNKNNILMCGIIVGYYKEDNCYWYNISCGEGNTLIFTYRNDGDIGEFDILGKLSKNWNQKLCKKVNDFVSGTGDW